MCINKKKRIWTTIQLQKTIFFLPFSIVIFFISRINESVSSALREYFYSVFYVLKFQINSSLMDSNSAFITFHIQLITYNHYGIKSELYLENVLTMVLDISHLIKTCISCEFSTNWKQYGSDFSFVI